MAAYIPFVNVAELVVYGLLAQQQVAMVLNFLYPGAITQTQLDNLAEGGVTVWAETLDDQLSEDLYITSGKATDLTTQDAGVSQYFPPTTVRGQVNNPSVANNAALVVSHHTALRGRSYRGRTYLAGIPTGQLANSATVTTEYQGYTLAAWTNYIDGLEALGGNFVIASRQLNGVRRTTGVATPVTGYSIDLRLDSQRRRLEGRGA